MSVRRRKLAFDEGYGYTKSLPKHYLIVLPKQAETFAQEMVLLHEWAHCRVWRAQQAGHTEAHDLLWALEYKRIWDWYSRSRGD